jgi:Tfp pilus assembly protein PilF
VLTAEQRAQLRQDVGLVEADAAQEPARSAVVDAGASARRAPSAAPSSRQAESWVAQADELWARGERDAARESYRRAGAIASVTGESALLALARRELSVSQPAQARAALRMYASRFAHGKLAGEALGIEFRTALAEHDLSAATSSAQRLVREYPGTPQARAAEQWLKARPAP